MIQEKFTQFVEIALQIGNYVRKNNIQITKFMLWGKKAKLPIYLYNNTKLYIWYNSVKKTLKFLKNQNLPKDYDRNFLSRNFGIVNEQFLDECIAKSKELLTELKNYVDQKSIEDQKFTNTSESSNVFLLNPVKLESNVEWFFYYLSFSKKEGETQTSKIVRTTLQMFKNGNAILYNSENLFREDYVGKWHVLNNSNVFSFTLKNRFSKSRELHFKFDWSEKERDLVVGGYLTYDKECIYSGSLVMIKKDHLTEISETDQKNRKQRKLILNPLILTKNSTLDDWSEENFPSEIIRYLSIKKRNYLKVPNKFSTLTGMNDFINNYDPFENRIDFFFDFKTPKVFIAFPQTSDHSKKGYLNNREKIEEQIKIIDKKLDRLANVTFRNIKDVDADLTVSTKRLSELQRTKYFILILTNVESVSFALIELGLALAYCKHILVLYDKKLVSKRFKTTINTLGVTVEDDISTLTSYETITKKIIDFIDRTERQ